MDYEFMHYRARDLQREAAHARLVREAQAGHRERSERRPGLLRRLAGAESAAGRLREC